MKTFTIFSLGVSAGIWLVIGCGYLFPQNTELYQKGYHDAITYVVKTIRENKDYTLTK